MSIKPGQVPEIPANADLLTVSEAAAMMRLQVSTVRAWLLQRKIPFVKLGRRVFLRMADVQALIERSVVPALPQES